MIHLNQYLNESELNEIISGCQRYLQEFWNVRKKLRLKDGAKEQGEGQQTNLHKERDMAYKETD